MAAISQFLLTGGAWNHSHFPVIEHALRRRLPLRLASQFRCESERFRDGYEGLESVESRPGTRLFRDDVTTTLMQHAVDAVDGR